MKLLKQRIVANLRENLMDGSVLILIATLLILASRFSG
jgi:hypothetical protein